MSDNVDYLDTSARERDSAMKIVDGSSKLFLEGEESESQRTRWINDVYRKTVGVLRPSRNPQLVTFTTSSSSHGYLAALPPQIVLVRFDF